MSDFQRILQNYVTSAMPLKEAYERTYQFRGNEPGFVHPVNHSAIRFRDDGVIDIFAEEYLGIRIDPNAQSVNIFADKFNVWSATTSIHTQRPNFLWNYMPINPDIKTMQRDIDEDGWPYIGPYDGQRREFVALFEYEQYSEATRSWHVIPVKHRPYLRDRALAMISVGIIRLNQFLQKFRLTLLRLR